MSLDSFFSDTPDDIPALIKRRRAQMLIHSCIYYELDSSVVSDTMWQEWADELERLQKAYPQHCKLGFFDFEFKDWTGATGNHLPLRDPWVIAKAKYVMNLDDAHKEKNSKIL